MKMNFDYCNLEDGILRYAPSVVRHNGMIMVNPAKEVYAALGWYKRVTANNEPADGKVWVECDPTDWAWDGETMTASVTYHAEDIPVPTPAPRVFSKLKCWAALREAGLWDAVQSYLESNGLWTAFLLAQDVSEDHPQFIAGLSAMKTALGLTDEQVESILANCVAEG